MDSQETPKGMILSYPQPGFISFSQGPVQTPVQLYKPKAPLQKFLKAEPKTLGVSQSSLLLTVQIMIALMNFSLGMILALIVLDPYRHDSFLFYTGYIFWGTAFIQSSLAMNIVSSVVAGLGIILFSVNLVVMDNIYHYYCHEESNYDVCAFGQSVLLGINVILLILTILEFIVSLTISGFGCKISCCGQSEVTVFMPPPPYVIENPAAEACKGGTTLQSPAADTSAFPGSYPDSFI
ncbi:membrane-spanning 4-domains subfamily A member 4A-like isoform X3 [Petaurus breviceps papuanus]|uniref:membrane-spanning 4-domains subfamily A member 4A-like isoform X3 n=1 Tax=Petaurus breviceps papuanus TaxID=3040969 RepID=UPI0036DBF23F